jgi:hypothetical protein
MRGGPTHILSPVMLVFVRSNLRFRSYISAIPYVLEAFVAFLIQHEHAHEPARVLRRNRGVIGGRRRPKGDASTGLSTRHRRSNAPTGCRTFDSSRGIVSCVGESWTDVPGQPFYAHECAQPGANRPLTCGESSGGGGNRTRVPGRPAGSSTSVACGGSRPAAPAGGAPPDQPRSDVPDGARGAP